MGSWAGKAATRDTAGAVLAPGMRRGITWAALLGASAGYGCTCLGGGSLSVGGATPYLRCIAADPAPPDGLAPGALAARAQDRRLVVEGLARPVRIAVFSGPALGPAPSAEQIGAIAAAKAQLALLLGGVGDDPSTVAATLHALGGLPFPTLVVAGGRDDPARIAHALGALPSERRRVLDVSAYQAVQIGQDVLIPVAGSFDGRYASGPSACGHGLADLKQLASSLGKPEPGARRWLAAWEAPGRGGPLAVARTETGIDTGSADLAELAERVGAAGGLFAWPAVQALRPRADGGTRSVPLGVAGEDLQLVVPRLAGPALERSDGSLAPTGFALVRFDSDGLAVERIVDWGAPSEGG